MTTAELLKRIERMENLGRKNHWAYSLMHHLALLDEAKLRGVSK